MGGLTSVEVTTVVCGSSTVKGATGRGGGGGGLLGGGGGNIPTKGGSLGAASCKAINNVTNNVNGLKSGGCGGVVPNLLPVKGGGPVNLTTGRTVIGNTVLIGITLGDNVVDLPTLHTGHMVSGEDVIDTFLPLNAETGGGYTPVIEIIDEYFEGTVTGTHYID